MRAVVFALLFALVSPALAGELRLPPKEFVPDRATAVAVARAVLTPIFAATQIAPEEPLVAKRHGDVWVVSGTPPAAGNPSVIWAGGVAEVTLSARDGRILHVTHGQ